MDFFLRRRKRKPLVGNVQPSHVYALPPPLPAGGGPVMFGAPNGYSCIYSEMPNTYSRVAQSVYDTIRNVHPPPPTGPTSPVQAVGAGAGAGIVTNNDTGIGWAPFASPSLRKASMSPPGPLTSTDSTDSPAPRSAHFNRAGQQQQQRQRQQQQPPINTRAREPQPSISRHRPLISASSSSTSRPYRPDTPQRRLSSRRPPQTPTRKTTPITVMRIPSTSPSTSQLPQFSPSSPRRPVYSLLSSPYRESIRKASSLLVRELARPPTGIRPRDWDDVDNRMRSLVRLERVWGKTGAGGSPTASATPSTTGGSEDRERRLFCEAVHDGYVLCILLNKFKPGAITRVDPREVCNVKASNVTRFLAGAKQLGVAQDDLFQIDDLLEASSESLARVAQTIITLCELDGAGTPLSDQSSVLPPRRTYPDVPPSMGKKTQNRPTNAQLACIPHIPSTTPTPRPRPPAEEGLLHCDELNVPPHNPLSRMEKAILRRVEFGQNVDFSTIQLA